MSWGVNEEWPGASLEHGSGLMPFGHPSLSTRAMWCETIVKVDDLKDGLSL